MTHRHSLWPAIHAFARRYERTLLWLAVLEMFAIALLHCRHDTLFVVFTATVVLLNLLPLVAALVVERAAARRGR